MENMNNTLLFENDDEIDELEYNSDIVYKEGEKPFDVVRVTKKDFSVFELHRKYQNGSLKLDADFQRSNVWLPKQKCELIESIFMGLPLPIFYFKLSDDANYVVVDGRQRLTTLFEYMSDGFVLRNLKILDYLNDKRFSDLSKDFGVYQSQLEDYQVYSHVILPPTPDRVVFDIFDRVNRGGTKLNKQEIRNALYMGRGMDAIKTIVRDEAFVRATRIEPKYDTRMKGSYLITRFWAFYLCFCGRLHKDGAEYEYNGDADNLMEVMLNNINAMPVDELQDLCDKTVRWLDMAYYYMGNGAFRRGVSASVPINMNVFETEMYLMSLLDNQEYNRYDVDAIKNRILDVINSNVFIESIGNSRDNLYKVNTRFEMMRKLAKEIADD